MIDSEVFIGGCGRSGTTLLGSLLGSHPECVTVPESQFKYRMLTGRDVFGSDPDRLRAFLRTHRRFLDWGLDEDTLARVGAFDVARDLRTLVEAYGTERLQKDGRVWVDHTPNNFDHALSLAKAFPEARFIHLVRDGRAVAASVLPLPWGPHTILDAADWWLRRVAIGLAAETHFGTGSVLRIYYRDLVRRPQETLRTIQRFLGLDPRPVPLVGRESFDLPEFTREQHALVHEAPSPSRIDAWKRGLSSRDVELFELRAGVMLEYLGFERATRGPIRAETNWEALRARLRKLGRKRTQRGRHRRRAARRLRVPWRNRADGKA